MLHHTDPSPDRCHVNMTFIQLMENANDHEEKSNGIITACNLPDSTLNEWYLLYSDKKIVPLKAFDRRRIAKMATQMSHLKLSLNKQSANIIAVLHGLNQAIVESFLDKLKAWSIISFEDVAAVLNKLENLIAIMQDKCKDDIEDFINLLKFREETFAIGCQLAYTIELSQSGIETSYLERVMTRVRNLFSWSKRWVNQEVDAQNCSRNHVSVKISSQNANISSIEKDIEKFKPDVLRVEEVESITEGSININIIIQDEWEYANLKRDIECGLFVDRYCNWLKEKGETISEGEEIEVTLTYENSVEVIYTGKVMLKKNNSEIEDAMPTAHQTRHSDEYVTKIAEEKIQKLTDQDKRRIKRKLKQNDGTSVHYIAINMVSQNIINVLYELDRHNNGIIQSVLIKLEERKVISGYEMKHFDHHQLDNVRCLEYLVNMIALKDGKKIEAFISVVSAYSVKLGENINDVWEYSKHTRKTTLEDIQPNKDISCSKAENIQDDEVNNSQTASWILSVHRWFLPTAYPDIKLLLVGTSGNGKSSSRNTIFFDEREGFYFDTSPRSASMTRHCDEQTKCIDGRVVTIVDTPGTLHTDEWSIIREIYSAVEADEYGFDAIVITLKYNEDGFSEDERKSFDLLEKIFSSEYEIFFHHVILLFTFGDRWDELQRHTQIQGQISRTFQEEMIWYKWYPDIEIRTIMEKSRYRLVLFDNSKDVNARKKKGMSKDLLNMVEEIKSKNYRPFTKDNLPHLPYLEHILPPQPSRWWNFIYSWM